MKIRPRKWQCRHLIHQWEIVQDQFLNRGLPAQDGQCPKHSLRNLAQCVLGRSIQEGPHSALVDARATMDLYLWDRRTIKMMKEMS